MNQKSTSLTGVAVYTALMSEVRKMNFTINQLKKVNNSQYYHTNFRIGTKQVCRSTGETNKRKALKQLEQIAFDVIAQTKYPKSFSERTYEDANALYKSTTTWDKDKKSHHNWFRERIGELKITDLTAIKIQEMQTEYKESVCDDTVNRRFTHLSAVLNNCIKYGLLEKKPHIHRYTEGKNKTNRNVYTKDQIDLLLNACLKTGTTHLYYPILYSYYSGFRKSELINMKKEQYDDVFYKMLTQKNKRKNQMIKQKPKCKTIIDKCINNPTPFIFKGLGEKGGLGDFKNAWNTVRDEAGLHNKVWHELRHTAITNVAKASKSYFITKEFSRHESDVAMKPYLHFFDVDDTDYADDGADFDVTFDVTLVKRGQI